MSRKVYLNNAGHLDLPALALGNRSLENLIDNWDFESGLTGWTLSRSIISQETPPLAAGHPQKAKVGGRILKILDGATALTASVAYSITDWERYQGKTVTLGALCFCPAANDKSQTLRIWDGVAQSASAVIPKDGAWHWIVYSHPVAAAATILTVQPYVKGEAVLDGDDILYIAAIVLVEGDSCPAPSPKANRSLIEHHTADYILSQFESGHIVHTNLGAGAAVTLTLPQTVRAGFVCRFAVMAGQELRVDPGGAGAIYFNGAKQTDDYYIQSSTIGDCATFIADGNGDWVSCVSGTWAVEP